MSISKIITLTVLAAFLALGAWVLSDGLSGIDIIFKNPWAIATAADLIFGLIMMSILIAYNETSLLKGLGWIVSLFLLGNIATGIYFLINLPQLKAKLAE